jgi:hypothetical protein
LPGYVHPFTELADVFGDVRVDLHLRDVLRDGKERRGLKGRGDRLADVDVPRPMRRLRPSHCEPDAAP